MEFNDIAVMIKKQYSHIDLDDINVMVDCAKDILLNTLYPFDENVNEIPPRKESWIYRCVVEQIERKGMNSFVSYRENGLQVTFDKAGISQALINELIPLAGFGEV